MLLLLEEASFIRELNSWDNSSAVASDAFRSSFMDWTGNRAQQQHGQLAQDVTLT